MEVTGLPTDKFYKFLTVGGLIMIFSSVTYLFLIGEGTKHTEELTLAVGHDVRAHYLKNKIARILQRHPSIALADTIGVELAQVEGANLFARDQGSEPNTIFYQTYDSKVDSLENMVGEVNDLAERLAIEEVSFLIKDHYFINSAKDKQLAQILLTTSIIVGILSCLWGFRMWYRSEVKRRK